MAKYTRFRAYQLGSEGSSFSYFDGENFTLIEARLNDVNKARVSAEMKACGVQNVHCLHITSWDTDHCAKGDLETILSILQPTRVEYPGYPPHTDTGEDCLKIMQNYKKQNPSRTIQSIDPAYVKSLEAATRWGYRDIIYHPKYLSEDSNNNSTVQLFRTGSFNVASLGDIEDVYIGAYLRRQPSFAHETDILILAHHGADNGLTNSSFLKVVRPSIAVCSSNYDNQFEHPKETIRGLLNKYRIPIYTTKTGDLIVVSLLPHKGKYRVYNLISDSGKVSSTCDFVARKSSTLQNNEDTVRDHYFGSKRRFLGGRK